MMPLGQLADEIVRQSQQMTRTPVLVMPSYLSLRTPFFSQLIEALETRSRHRVRIDWYRDPGSHLLGWLATAWARRQARSINRLLKKKPAAPSDSALQAQAPTIEAAGLESPAIEELIEVTASIARPDPGGDVLVVGLCDDRIELPSWAAAVRLSGWPIAPVDDKRPS